MAFASLYIDQPYISSERISCRPSVVTAGIAMPEASSNQLVVDRLTVFFHFHLTDQFYIVGSQINACNTAYLFAEAWLES